MGELDEKGGRFINSIDLIKRTGFSRATLNNYIKAGILPRPIVKKPNLTDLSKAKRIGYFPVSVLRILDDIIQSKKKGLSMERIRKTFSEKSNVSPRRSPISGRRIGPIGVRASDRVSETQELFPLEESRLEIESPDMPEKAYGKKQSAKERAFQEHFQQPLPIPLAFSILAADLQDSIRMCAELTPEEYFRLIHQIWTCANSTFEKYYGIYGKHSGNGIVYYFLKNRNSNYLIDAILCALKLREKMKTLTDKWKKDTGWCSALYLNIGINEGYEFFGRIPAAPTGEVITLGDTANFTVRLSHFARCGSIWATKNLLNRLDEKERKKIRYGICRSQANHELLTENTFSRIGDLIPNNSDNYSIINDISTMIVTEIYNLH
jgi:class 3 adenylate cyclase